MVIRREKKSRKMRGHRTMGWGSKGQHRDRGAQGGRQVGMHKEKWSWLVKYGKGWYGKHGFVNPTSRRISIITLRQLQEKIEKGEISPKVESGKKVVDLTEYGFEKLLGSGKILEGYVIKVNAATEKAINKVKSMGGEIILSSSS